MTLAMEISGVGEALGASDILVLQRVDGGLRLLGGTMEVDLADKPQARLAAAGSSPVRLAGSEPIRVIGPRRA